ncbi:MAG TPA: BhlA/UviB family holin-like peptide [Anaerolineales bacterium]|nr:BhlA/UviB family holin-like peptide [Anaerolineales bacterium]
METLLCVGGILAVLSLILFFYLLNTARKKSPVPTAGKKTYTPVYISIADKPDSIMQGMDRFVKEVQKTETAGDKWRWVPLLIFFAGLGLMSIDGLLLLLGYTSVVFVAGGVGLWIASLVMARSLRKSDSNDFSPRYKGAKEILYTLRDDLKPDTTFLGHLDLTGAMLKTKVAREAKDSQDRTTQYFRDEWLALKAKLYDGNILRVSAIQRSKQRQPYWKRSRISGKLKQKPAKLKGTEQQLKVRIAVNPEVYKIVPNKEFRQGANIGKYTVAQLNTEGGIIDVTANSPFEEVEPEHILGFLHSTYSLLQRKAA